MKREFENKVVLNHCDEKFWILSIENVKVHSAYDMSIIFKDGKALEWNI